MAQSIDLSHVDSGSEVDTIIGPSVQIEGDFISKGNIKVEGVVKGRLETEKDLEIAQSANVEANVSSNNMVIAGKVSGDIKAKGKITILESGRVFGDVTSATLAINPGAVFSGQSNMSNGADEDKSDMSGLLKKEKKVTVEVSK